MTPSTISDMLSVTELTQAIKNQLESNFTSLTVKGEVTNLRKQASGHYYFSLKDENAQISAVLFRGNAHLTSYLPKMGEEVVVKGELNVYPPRGTYQIIVRKIRGAGLGELLLQLHQLKTKLEKKGWFEKKHKKPLPLYPKIIGVITSPTGAVIQDIIHVLQRRFQNFHLILNPVKVQGVGAAVEIAEAIKAFNLYQLSDVLIIGRGGGSLEDLWAFNEECVARAIFLSKIPIISAVGHETDLTIADCVADVRAPTPSAAAEISVQELQSQLDFLQSAQKQALSALSKRIKEHRLKLKSILRIPLFSSSDLFLADRYQQIDSIQETLTLQMKTQINERHLKLSGLKKQLKVLNPKTQLRRFKEKMTSYEKSLQRLISSQFKRKQEQFKPRELSLFIQNQLFKKLKREKDKLAHLNAQLKSIHPKHLLKKGYCIPFSEKGHSVIMSTHHVKAGERISLQLYDGNLKSTIHEVQPYDRKKPNSFFF